MRTIMVELITTESRSSTLNQTIGGLNYRSNSPPGSIWALLIGITSDKESSSLGLSGQGPHHQVPFSLLLYLFSQEKLLL